MRRIIVLFITVILMNGIIHAESKTLIREYSYQASELDNKIKARENALSILKELAIQEVASYVESDFNSSFNEKTDGKNAEYSETSNHNIKSLTAGYIKVKILDETWNGVTFWVKAELVVDEQEIRSQLQDLIKKSLGNDVPDWFIEPPQMKGKTVAVGSSDTKEAALISALHNYAFKMENKKEKLPGTSVYFSSPPPPENAETEQGYSFSKSLFKYSFTPNVKVSCIAKSQRNFEDYADQTEYLTKLEVSKNGKKRIVKFWELGDVNGNNRITKQMSVEQTDLSFEYYFSALTNNGYKIKIEDRKKNNEPHWFALIVK